MKRCIGFLAFSFVILFALVALAGHRPVSCKGYMYWDIYEAHQGGHRWRKVEKPVTIFSNPIAASHIWNLSEAAQYALLVMHSKAVQQAAGSLIKVRDHNSICWYLGDAVPETPSWPVKP